MPITITAANAFIFVPLYSVSFGSDGLYEREIPEGFPMVKVHYWKAVEILQFEWFVFSADSISDVPLSLVAWFISVVG
jgi:hypothetical protein